MFIAFFFPELDFSASHNCSYYVVFLLCYYLIVLSSEFMLGKKEFIFILISAPVAVWSKPVFFLLWSNSFTYRCATILKVTKDRINRLV